MQSLRNVLWDEHKVGEGNLCEPTDLHSKAANGRASIFSTGKTQVTTTFLFLLLTGYFYFYLFPIPISPALMTNGRKLHYPRANNYLQLGGIHVSHYSDLPQKERKSLLGWPVSFLSEILFQEASFDQETADGTTAVWLEEEHVGTKEWGCTGAILSKVLGVAPGIEEQTMWALWNTTRGSSCRQKAWRHGMEFASNACL